MKYEYINTYLLVQAKTKVYFRVWLNNYKHTVVIIRVEAQIYNKANTCIVITFFKVKSSIQTLREISEI